MHFAYICKYFLRFYAAVANPCILHIQLNGCKCRCHVGCIAASLNAFPLTQGLILGRSFGTFQIEPTEARLKENPPYNRKLFNFSIDLQLNFYNLNKQVIKKNFNL